MSNEEKAVKKVNPEESGAKDASQKIVDNHKKAAMHHEAAAKLHHDAAKHQMDGNNTMACGCNCKAKDQADLAKKAQKKNAKKHSVLA